MIQVQHWGQFKFSLIQHLVFLYRLLVDIDQLKLILMLVGTPGPDLLMKISSESVSSQIHARFFPSSPILPLFCASTQRGLCSYWRHVFPPFGLLVCLRCACCLFKGEIEVFAMRLLWHMDSFLSQSLDYFLSQHCGAPKVRSRNVGLRTT